MTDVDKYFDCNNSNIGTGQLLKLLTAIDENSKPFFRNNNTNGDILPPPPFLVASKNGNTVFNSINFSNVTQGDFAESNAFGIFGKGFNILEGNIETTITENLEILFEFTWQPGPIDYDFTSGELNTDINIKVRLKSFLPVGVYNETITITGPSGINVPPFVISVKAEVIANNDYIQMTGGIEYIAGGMKFHIINSTDIIVKTNDGVGDLNKCQGFIAGGGASGGCTNGGGGGAARALKLVDFIIPLGSNPFVIGAGGAPSIINHTPGFAGNDTTFLYYVARGGGYGGHYPDGSGGDGGSGGGSGPVQSGGLLFGGTADSSYGGVGFDGGRGQFQGLYLGGGGSGAGFAGLWGGTNLPDAGSGGDGILISLEAIARYYCAGGGGGSDTGLITNGVGGLGGGGNGSSSILGNIAGNGEINSGSGGGGGDGTFASVSGAGGSGKGIICYTYPFAI